LLANLIFQKCPDTCCACYQLKQNSSEIRFSPSVATLAVLAIYIAKHFKRDFLPSVATPDLLAGKQELS